MSKKNLVIIRNAAPYDFGGGERFPVFLAQILATQQYCPVIISRSKKLLNFANDNSVKTIKGWWWNKQQWSGANNVLLPLYFGWQIILFFYYLVLFLKIKPAAVHIQSKDDFIAGTYAAKSLGIRVIWTDHADLKHIWRSISVWYKNPTGKAVHHAARYTHKITVVSKSELQLITEQLPNNSKIRSKITVIYNGVVDQSSAYPKHARKAFTYLVASRLVTDKGINEVLEAFLTLTKSYRNIKLNIIGDGPESPIFKKKAAEIPGVKLLGHQKDPLRHMANADAFIHPTYHEGFSVALVEAGMMSLPIIATAVGGNVEIIENAKTGVLVPVKNTEALCVAMERVYSDELFRKKLASAARVQYIQKFQFDTIVKDRFIPLYGGDQ